MQCAPINVCLIRERPERGILLSFDEGGESWGRWWEMEEVGTVRVMTGCGDGGRYGEKGGGSGDSGDSGVGTGDG